ncbi:MAG: low molecular weight phosphotyrosine protein phosphatase [Selenomonadaceae bacterium]|nr:low molecular weight phosphotyrosine protein phosphatase [Selenomonadaceae bacterium]
MKKILFVCSGNTGRSPMAEFFMKNLVKNFDEEFLIASAASKPTDGGDLHEGIAAKLREENIPYTKHTARQITADDYAKFDKIVCMDKGNIEQVKAICGGDSDGKIKLLLSYCGEEKDIPWDKNGFAETFIDIERGCKALLESLN